MADALKQERQAVSGGLYSRLRHFPPLLRRTNRAAIVPRLRNDGGSQPPLKTSIYLGPEVEGGELAC
jgi:hypothetical protein